MRKPVLLSFFIAYHKDLTYELAQLIVQKGTASEDHFIKRFPMLKIYRKKISLPSISHDFNIKNSRSLFRAYHLQSLNPTFFSNHFANHIYQPLNYKKAYSNYNGTDKNKKKLFNYVKKELKNSKPKFEIERLKIIKILKNHHVLKTLSKILPKRVQYFLIEFSASESKTKILISIMAIALFINIHQCIMVLLKQKKSISYLNIIFLLSLLCIIKYSKKFNKTLNKDTLYDPYYFIYL